MKEWEITFVDQYGVKASLPCVGEQRPSHEDAARLIRSHLFPVMDALDLNDYQGKDPAPTAKWLVENSGVHILDITQLS